MCVQSEVLGEQVRVLERELVERKERINALDKGRQELYEKLVAAEGGKKSSEAGRLEQQLAALQVRSGVGWVPALLHGGRVNGCVFSG